MGINKVVSDFGSDSNASSSKPFNWQAGNLSLQPMSSIPSAPAYNGWPAGNVSLQPSYQAPRDTYNVPLSELNPANQTQYGGVAGGGGGGYAAPVGGGGGGAAPAAPAAPRGPAVGGRAWYNSLDAGAKAAQDQQWLGGDSDYTAQLGEYDKALSDFISRITAQKEGFTKDTNRAVQANSDNQQLAGNQLGEDFGARGMMYSGLWDKSLGLQNKRFKDQEENINRVGLQNQTDADNRLGDFKSQNSIDRNNAMRAALGRMAQQQSIIDSQNPF